MTESSLLERLDALVYSGPARVHALVAKPAVGMHVLHDHLELEAGHGSTSDHKQKDWWKDKRIPEREFTAITKEVLDALGATAVTSGDNLVTEGVDLRALKPGQRIRIGDVVLRRAVKDHRPCHLFERRTSEAGRKAVSDLNLRGALFAVETGGVISAADSIEVMP